MYNNDSLVYNNDSGMSSSDTEDFSRKLDLDTITSDKKVVLTKCLIEEPVCANWNQIPSSSNDVNLSICEEDTSGLELDDTIDECTDNQVSDYYVIDLSCDANDLVNRSDLNLDVTSSLEQNSCESQALLPIRNNELVRSEREKLVSLSLSILLAAVLQAVRCFAQFLENFVVHPR